MRVKRDIERRRNARVERTGDPRENPPTSGIVRQDPTCENPGTDPVLVGETGLNRAFHSPIVTCKSEGFDSEVVHCTGVMTRWRDNEGRKSRDTAVLTERSRRLRDAIWRVAVQVSPGPVRAGTWPLTAHARSPANRCILEAQCRKCSLFASSIDVASGKAVYLAGWLAGWGRYNQSNFALPIYGNTKLAIYQWQLLCGRGNFSPVAAQSSLNFSFGFYVPVHLSDPTALTRSIPVFKPVRANRVRFRWGSLLGFRTWELCRTRPLVVGFSRESPVSSALAFRCWEIFILCVSSPQDLDSKSRPNLSRLSTIPVNVQYGWKARARLTSCMNDAPHPAKGPPRRYGREEPWLASTA
ncbi:hypothetical protein PR048_004751 [Dryococelus australis]|uniref:Uncharacterized protein n=1 Tax=Dryococelus australis TaxID=614101 RepID=A0ABQ9I686_9NEOP|nr:hypothetical protein PR048_004751 [Dryococelus australis]